MRHSRWFILGAMRVLAVSAVIVAGSASSSLLGAQQLTQAPAGAPAYVRGRVVDAATRTPVAGAEIHLAGPTLVTIRSDGDGVWRSPPLSAGRYTLRVRSVGYSAHTAAVELTPGDDIDRRIVLDAVPLALDRVVVTASRREQMLKDVAITTELVTRDDIERSGATDLGSVLMEQTGIELQGGHPAGAGVMLQGIGSERILVLLDGQPLVGRIAGVFDVSRIPVSMVERIEIVKGPQSTLYGSEAMGGVVNIITRAAEATALGATATLFAGTQGRLDGSAGIVAGRGSLSSSLDLSRRVTETTPGRAEEGGALAARSDLAAKIRWARDSTYSLEAALLALDERQRWRTGTFYNFGDNTQWSGRLGGTWLRGRHRFSPTVFASVFDHLSRGSTEPKPIAGDTGQRQIQRLYQAEALYSTRLGSDALHALDLGVQIKRDETESARVRGGLRSTTSAEPFVQLELVPTPRVSVLPGVRISHNSQWGTHTTPRVAARYRLTDALTLRASTGTGFRAPDFKELYMFFQNTGAGYAVIGSPDLQPERSTNVTGGAEWTSDHAYLRGQLFWNRFRDFIETRAITAPGEPPVYQYANVDDGSTRGVDLEVGTSFRSLRLESSYSGLSTRDRASGRPLLGRPSHSGRATLGYTLPSGTRASVSGIYTGRTPMRRDEASGAVTSWRDPFARIDVRLAHRLPGGFELVAGADNLFDEQPAEWAGFTGRHLYTALSWALDRENSR